MEILDGDPFIHYDIVCGHQSQSPFAAPTIGSHLNICGDRNIASCPIFSVGCSQAVIYSAIESGYDLVRPVAIDSNFLRIKEKMPSRRKEDAIPDTLEIDGLT